MADDTAPAGGGDTSAAPLPAAARKSRSASRKPAPQDAGAPPVSSEFPAGRRPARPAPAAPGGDPSTGPIAGPAANLAANPATNPAANPATITAGARLLWVEAGLHTLSVAPNRAPSRDAAGMTLPGVLIAAAGTGDGAEVEIIAEAGAGPWLTAAGGTVVLRAPPRGGHVLVTLYTLPDQAAGPLDVELQPIAGAQGGRAPAQPPAAGAQSGLRAEILLHIEREGDRRFAASGWAGRLGSRRRIEAMAVYPLEAISQGEIEYKAFTSGGRETPWVTDGRLCGTRGRGLPLTGFAVRVAPHLRDAYDVVYRGAFFSSGPGPVTRNGDPCLASLRDDPLEAIEIRITERAG